MGRCNGQVEVIDLITSYSKTEEDDDFNNEDEEDSFIDDDDYDDSSPNINDFYMEMKGDPIYSPRSRALCEWDPEYWHGYLVWDSVYILREIFVTHSWCVPNMCLA